MPEIGSYSKSTRSRSSDGNLGHFSGGRFLFKGSIGMTDVWALSYAAKNRTKCLKWAVALYKFLFFRKPLRAGGGGGEEEEKGEKEKRFYR